MSAVMGSQVFTEFLLDGGYYPGDRVQVIPETLSKVFLECNGKLLLSSPVKKIRIDDGHVKGVVLNSGDVILSRYVISDCDARKTFCEMIGPQLLPADFSRTLESMTPSLSAFILYLGIGQSFDSSLAPGTNFWYLSHHNFDHLHASGDLGILKNAVGYLLHVSHDRNTLTAFINVPYMNERFWGDNKENMISVFTGKIATDVIPNLMDHVVYADAATPATLRRYTMNHDGATFGWAITPSQVGLPHMRKPSFLGGLYLTSHWVTRGLGISGVTHVAYDTAKMILRKEKRCSHIK
jgi:phytoene dehydrogenase-like protein